MSYKDYLEERNYLSSHRDKQLQVSERFDLWLSLQNLEIEDCRYNEALAYLEYLNQRGIKKNSIQKILSSTCCYWDYLKMTKQVDKNIFDSIEVKGKERKLLYDILKKKQLEQLYDTYPKNTETAQRERITIGLFVFQGISARDLKKLEIRHLKLEEGWITIEGNSQSNRRDLLLSPKQILDFHSYLTYVRPSLGNHPNLIVNTLGEPQIQNMLTKITQRLRKDYPFFKSFKQVRASIITDWVKTLNLREAQYRAGHRYVSSTEDYKVNNIEELSDDIERFHPLG